MKASGQGRQAIAKYQLLAEESTEDDLFTVAIDGLLNLDASPSVMAAAYRRILTRIAAAPEKIFLYSLAEDVLTAMNRPRDVIPLSEQSLIFAGERRSTILRDLMESAETDGRTSELIAYGRSLLALGDQVPPQVFLDLGRAMLIEGDIFLSQQVFARADVGENTTAYVQQVAEYYDEANVPTVADRLIRQALITEPDQVNLLIHSGSLAEEVGQIDRAQEQYGHAVDLIIRRLPATIQNNINTSTKPQYDRSSQKYSRQGNNIDEFTQYYEAAANGLLATAVSASQKNHLLNKLVQRLDDEINSLALSRAIQPAISYHPRIEHLSDLLRRAAFSLHQPELADRADERLLSLFLADRKLAETLIQSRIQWGLYRRALQISKKIKGSLPLIPEYVSAMILTGQNEEARVYLRTLKPLPAEITVNTASEMTLFALVLDDEAAFQTWKHYWLNAILMLKNGAVAEKEFERYVNVLWNDLSPQEQQDLLENIRKLTDSLPAVEQLPLNLMRLNLVEGMGLKTTDLHKIVWNAAENSTLDAQTSAQLLEKIPSADRPALLRKILSNRKPAGVRRYLLELSDEMTPTGRSKVCRFICEIIPVRTSDENGNGTGLLDVECRQMDTKHE